MFLLCWVFLFLVFRNPKDSMFYPRILGCFSETRIRQQMHQAKPPCLRNQMSCHDRSLIFYNFFLVGAAAIDFASRTPLALRTKENGEPDDIPMYIKETWGLIYGKGHKCDIHTHWPSLWSYTYCVNACSDCAPLVFSNAESDKEKYIVPQTGQMVIFPSWLNHEVPEHECDHDRVMISGNLDVESEALQQREWD